MDKRLIEFGKLNFYPRSPCGERRGYGQYCIRAREISIHALLAESDSPASVTPAASRNFYPRSPCGERPQNRYSFKPSYLFLSTLSLRRATHNLWRALCPPLFLSTLSLRRATTELVRDRPKEKFLSTLSLRRATFRHCTTYLNCSHFYPRSPCGERRLIY